MSVRTHLLEPTNIGIADNAANYPNTWHDVEVSVLTPPSPPKPVPTEKVTPVAGGDS